MKHDSDASNLGGGEVMELILDCEMPSSPDTWFGFFD